MPSKSKHSKPTSHNLFDQLLSESLFPPLQVLPNGKALPALFSKSRRAGLYLLLFETNEIYIGQTRTPQVRLRNHKKTYHDIVAATFKRVLIRDLDAEEEKAIKTFEKFGFKVRNVTHASRPSGPSKFDDVISMEDQELFLAGRAQPCGHVRSDLTEVRRKSVTNYSKFSLLPHASKMLVIVAAYGWATLPMPSLTEVGYWCITCLPGGRAKGVGRSIFTRLNINKQEVFNIADREGIHTNFFVARSALEVAWGIEFEEHNHDPDEIFAMPDSYIYKPGGYDQIRVVAEGLAATSRLLKDEGFIAAARLFNLNLMRKGSNFYPQNHCPQIADVIFDKKRRR